MKSKILMTTLALAFVMQACNLPSNVAATETPTLAVPPSATQPLPTDTATLTPLPSDTPLPTLTFTPTVPVASARDVAVNCRLGPGTEWIALSGLNVGQTAQILGKNSAGSWWFIVDPFNSGKNCWVAASVTNAAGNLAAIPIVETPKASVTKVTVKVEPKTISVPGCIGPILPSKITGTIEVNGPATVKWYFETEQGGAFSTKTSEFDAFGTKEVSMEYTPPLTAGSYWVRLIVTSPNDIEDEVKYKIEC